MKLANMGAIVTGGGSGIGKATALLLGKEGAKVAVCGRRYDTLMETVEIIQSYGGEAIAIKTDLQDSVQIRKMVDVAQENFDQINILVNNAGVAIAKPLVDLEEVEWNQMLDTNLKSIFLTCKLIIPPMLKAKEGVIINVSSILGIKGIANFTAYSASKFGVIGLTQALAEECRLDSIRVYAICPGRTATEMQRQLSSQKIANLSMPSEKIANKIIGLITKKINLPSGGNVIMDEQSISLRLYESRQLCTQLLAKINPTIFKLKQFLKYQNK